MVNLVERVEIICANGAEYPYDQHKYDVAICTGASFIWENFSGALRSLSTAINRNGKIIIGEPYWLSYQIPTEYRQRRKEVNNEFELLQIIHEDGFELEYLVRASHDDWDRYEAGNWNGLVRWIEE